MKLCFIGVILGVAPYVVADDGNPPYRVERFPENPIIRPVMLGRDGDNINGPSLIKVPEWLPNKLGAYYLYFAHHQGAYIRLAYSNNLHGPWSIYQSGVLATKETGWEPSHVASPDAVIDSEQHEIRLYFHAPVRPTGLQGNAPTRQDSFVATSKDGLHFIVRAASLGPSYFRVWQRDGFYYAMAGFGSPIERSRDGFAPFEHAPRSPFEQNQAFGPIRHVGLFAERDLLTVFFTRIGDAPERIFVSEIEMAGDWMSWHASAPALVLKPETDYEGTNLPLMPSAGGPATGPENALRDPAVYREDGHLYLLYSVSGEQGIAIAELTKR